MIKLCCTQQILKKLKLDPVAIKAQEPITTTSALGDWYAKYIINERQHAIVMVNDRTRMCLVTTAKDIQHLPQRLEAALADLDLEVAAFDHANADGTANIDAVIADYNGGPRQAREVLAGRQPKAKPQQQAPSAARQGHAPCAHPSRSPLLALCEEPGYRRVEVPLSGAGGPLCGGFPLCRADADRGDRRRAACGQSL